MHVPVSEAKGQLTELVRRAESGEEIVLTRHGHAAVKLAPCKRRLSPDEKERIIREVMAFGVRDALPGPSAARSQDFLYDGDDLWTRSPCVSRRRKGVFSRLRELNACSSPRRLLLKL